MRSHLTSRLAGPMLAAAAGVLYVAGPTTVWMTVICIVVIVGGLAWTAFDAVRARAMREEYGQFALQHGWEYAPVTYDYASRFTAYPFMEGTNRRAEHMVRGDYDGVRCATFAHVFEARSQRDSAPLVRSHQVTLAELPVTLPRLDIVPQDLPATIAKALGGRDVDVESHAFNQRWRVLCDDPRYAHAVIDPRMIERLLYPDVEGMAVRIEGGAVYVWTPGRQGAADLSRRLGAVAAIARRIPEHVIREHRELGRTVHRGDVLTRPLSGPAWATEPGALTSGRYTGVGVDADGDGIEDWYQRPRS